MSHLEQISSHWAVVAGATIIMFFGGNCVSSCMVKHEQMRPYVQCLVSVNTTRTGTPSDCLPPEAPE